MGEETKDLICFCFFLFFCSLECFKCRWVDGGGVEEKVLGPSEIAFLLIASAKILACEESKSLFSLYGQLPNY